MQVDEDLKKAAGLTDQQYINQFPFEACLVMKHHLAETVQKVRKRSSLCMLSASKRTRLSQLTASWHLG
jgi:tubulin--tyrosine ligase-like protein 12